MPAEGHNRGIVVSYGREAHSALYQWQRRMQTRLGNAAVLLIARNYRRIPPRAASRIGAGTGTLVRLLSPRHRRIVMTNLRIAFGQEKTEAELARIAAACYQHLGRCLVEFVRLPGMSSEEVRRVTEMRGSEHLDRALAEGKGGIVLTGHVGNWEMVGARLAADGYPLNVIARAQRDSTLTEYIRRTRETAGMRVFHRGSAVKRCLGALRKNELVGVLLDQNAGSEGVFVDFFGSPASTAPGAAAFALRTGAAVLPTFGWRNPDGTHSVVVSEPVPLVRTGDHREDMRVNTARYTKIIENAIRAHPEQWLWLHKRWKSRPPGEGG